MNAPDNFLYTNDHEWLLLDGEIATIGITDYAQAELGDIVFVDIDTLDETLEKEEVFGSVEAVKTVSDLLLPISGEVIEFNEMLEDAPEKINTDPYGEGWIIKLKISDKKQLTNLLDAKAYKELLAE